MQHDSNYMAAAVLSYSGRAVTASFMMRSRWASKYASVIMVSKKVFSCLTSAYGFVGDNP